LESLAESNETISLLEEVKNKEPDTVFEFRQTDLEFSFESRVDGMGIVPKKNPYVFEVRGYGGYTDVTFGKRLEYLLNMYKSTDSNLEIDCSSNS
jgi:hypothetical protein